MADAIELVILPQDHINKNPITIKLKVPLKFDYFTYRLKIPTEKPPRNTIVKPADKQKRQILIDFNLVHKPSHHVSL